MIIEELNKMVKVFVTDHALKRLAERGAMAISLKDALEKGTLLSKGRDGSLLIHSYPFYYALERDISGYVLVTVYTGIPFGLWKKGVQRTSKRSPLKHVKLIYR